MRLFLFPHFLSYILFCSLVSVPFSRSSLASEMNSRPVIYQLVVRHFGNSNATNKPSGTLQENGSGKFEDINSRALREIKNMGVTHIWLTGVLQQATSTDYSTYGEPADDPDLVKGRAGSFFAIRDYFDVSADYAVNPENRLNEFKALVDRIHDSNMKVIIDLVPNHVARSYASNIRPDLDPGISDDQTISLKLENNFVYVPASKQAPLILPSDRTGWQIEGMDGRFLKEDGTPGQFVKATGNRVLSTAPSPTDWYETVLLNYGFDFLKNGSLFGSGNLSNKIPANSTWTFMDEVIQYWSTEYAIDGFRADFAHWVPTEAWRWLIREARDRKPSLYFVAEAYENFPDLLAAGFDAVYDDESYDSLKGLQNQTVSLLRFKERLLSRNDSDRNMYLRYLENHDERRFASSVEYGVNPDLSGFGDMNDARLFAPIQYLVAGGPILVYNGQTVGETGEGFEGFDGENGKTSIFDYWQPRHLARWVNNGNFGMTQLSRQEISLHQYYSSLLKYAQLPDFRSNRFYLLQCDELKSQNHVLAFARYVTGGGRLKIVVSNFGGEQRVLDLKLPADLVISYAQLQSGNRVAVDFTRDGMDSRQEQSIVSRDKLMDSGLRVVVPPRSSVVYAIESISN